MKDDNNKQVASKVQSATALLRRVKGYPARKADKVQPWKKWFSLEAKSDKPTVVLIPSKYDFGSANLGGF